MSKLLHLQVLRALAALAIAVLHAQHDAGALAARLGLRFAPLDAPPWTAGVDVFFVVSGFIMVYASRSLFGAAGARRAFLARRVARIVPLYWAVTTLFVIVALLGPALLNGEALGFWPVVASYLFVPAARPDGLVQPVYSLGWTLNYEVFFYLLFALALGAPRRWAVAGVIAALAGLALLGQAFWPLPLPFRFWADPIVLEFAFGAGLGLLYAEGARLGGPARAALALAGLGLLALDLARYDSSVPIHRAFAHGLPAAMLVAAAALREPERGGEAGPLTRAAVLVGDASYALYLVHPFVIRAGREAVLATGGGAVLGPWGFVALALAASVLVAVAVHLGFERPATERLRRVLESRAPTRSPGRATPSPL